MKDSKNSQPKANRNGEFLLDFLDYIPEEIPEEEEFETMAAIGDKNPRGFSAEKNARYQVYLANLKED